MISRLKKLIMDQFTTCPKTGKITGLKIAEKKAFWLWFIVGIASVIWVVIRVVPKPSRASYPCQKVAQPLAAGFIAWLLGLAGSTLILSRARQMFKRKRYIVGITCFAIGAVFSFITLHHTSEVAASAAKYAGAQATFTPSDAANTPVGEGKGINPGRVVWVYSDKLLDQKSTSGFYWKDERTDPDEAMQMMSQGIMNLTGEDDLANAWDALFKNFNKTRYNETGVGYKAGDKIAIKVNNIFSRQYEWTRSRENLPSPQIMHALITGLVKYAGVPEEDITFYDCIFYHGDPVYDYCHKAYPGVRFAEGDATDRKNYEGGPGKNPGTREKIVRDPNCVVHFGDTDLIKGSGKVCLPTVVSEAKYIMNIGLPRAHELGGYTGCAKNFFGSVWHPTIYDYYHQWQPMFMHNSICAVKDFSGIEMRKMGTYNALVDLMGHKDLGGKTILCMIQALRYKYWNAAPFNGGHASSVFMSQDFVAIESVLIDFLRSEGGLPEGTLDNYLHEAAQANNPPSGTVYDPENDGVPLKSLGVHEHWNNSTDKQYTRNLGTGTGLELVQVINPDPITFTEPVNGINYAQINNFEVSNYPNPFNQSTNIRYSLQSSADVRLNIYNMNGQLVRTLYNQYQSAGSFEITWNGQNNHNAYVSQGNYICKMDVNTGNKIMSKSVQMLLVK